MKIYTKKGDLGQTDLMTKRVSKADLRIAVNGAIDETMATLLLLKHEVINDDILKEIDQIHADLFQIAYEIALNNKDKYITKTEHVTWLESRIDFYDEKLTPLTKFIKLDQTRAASWANMTRVTVRRAERELVELSLDQEVNPLTVSYLNRLSDYMFTLGRIFDEVLGGK